MVFDCTIHTCIPVELFFGFMGLSFAIAIIGLCQRIPMLTLIGGSMITFWSLITDAILMGKIPDTSIVSGSTTTFTFVDNPYIFTQWPKILIAVIGSIIVLVGGLEWNKKED